MKKLLFAVICIMLGVLLGTQLTFNKKVGINSTGCYRIVNVQGFGYGIDIPLEFMGSINPYEAGEWVLK